MAEECLFLFPLSHISCHVSCIFFLSSFYFGHATCPSFCFFSIDIFQIPCTNTTACPLRKSPKHYKRLPFMVWKNIGEEWKNEKHSNRFVRPFAVLFISVYIYVCFTCQSVLLMLICFMWKTRPGMLLMLTKRRHNSAPLPAN